MHHNSGSSLFVELSHFKPVEITTGKMDVIRSEMNPTQSLISESKSIIPVNMQAPQSSSSHEMVSCDETETLPLFTKEIIKPGHLYGFPETFKTTSGDSRDCYIVRVSTRHTCKFNKREILTKTEILAESVMVIMSSFVCIWVVKPKIP